MNAAKFIADKGWDLAQRDVVCLETGFITKADFLEHYGFEILDEMKIYVDAWELVEDIGYDLNGAKQVCDFAGDMKYLQKRGKLILVEDIRKAIALVEEVESLKEVS